MNTLQIVILVFISLVLFALAIYMWYMAITTSPKFELKRRLRRLAVDFSDRRFPEDLRIEILQGMSPLDKALFKLKPVRWFDKLIEKSGIKADVKLFIALMITCAVLGFALGIFINRGIWVSFVLAIIGAIAPILFLNSKKKARLEKFTEIFPDALDMVSRSLKAGHSFSSAMQLIATEMAEPVAGIFKTAYEEQALGVSTREAIAHMADRIDSIDLKFFIMAINIHREIGGNLGEILERLAKTIRERMTIKRQVKVFTAQARLSGYVLAAAPLAMAAIFYFFQPGYVEELWRAKVGRYALAFAAIGQIMGFLIIRKIVNIRI